MLSINVPIDDYIEKTFKINEDDMVILPRRKKEEIKNVSLDISLSDPKGIKNIDNEIISALSDGYINGYIDKHFKENMTKEEAKEFLKNAVTLALFRDNSSGGLVRIVDITKDGFTREYYPYNQLKLPNMP